MQILKIILFLLAVNALYIGTHFLAKKIRRNSPVPRKVAFDEDKMKQDLLNERFEGCDEQTVGCGLQCPLAQYCNPRHLENSGDSPALRED